MEAGVGLVVAEVATSACHLNNDETNLYVDQAAAAGTSATVV
jgi:hypothetical protein